MKTATAPAINENFKWLTGPAKVAAIKQQILLNQVANYSGDAGRARLAAHVEFYGELYK